MQKDHSEWTASYRTIFDTGFRIGTDTIDTTDDNDDRLTLLPTSQLPWFQFTTSFPAVKLDRYRVFWNLSSVISL